MPRRQVKTTVRRYTPPQHRDDVRAKAPKRTPRLSEAEKREGARKRRKRAENQEGWVQGDWDAEYQRLADDEVRRASAVVRATPRDTARRRREATEAHTRRERGR